MPFEFKPLQLGSDAKREKRKAQWKHVGKTVLYMAAGALISLGLSYLSEGSQLNGEEIKNALFIGAGLGLFITNSPCARGRC